MADESLQDSTIDKADRGSAKAVLFKIAEVVLAVFSVGLIVDPFNSFQQIFNKPRTKLDDIAFIYITIGGFVIFNTLFAISHVLGDRIPKRTTMMFAAVGALFHVVAGSVIVHNWRKLHGDYVYVQNNAIYPSKQYMDMLISGAVFTFLDAAIFVAEVVFVFKYS
ncbi:uncharacterized protein LOC105701075 [Orussus abietinus]|uniref:uncharacterized protein LOC105701075 n=1 Tax=Orussus abietinus TaxID=222816 RepID=UPI00062643FD|nr:uncharacterized protein LOC105701075 [Orussus abietinus]